MHTAVALLIGSLLLTTAPLAAKPPAKPRPPVLPSWAPKHPSQEFLRAAKVFRPIPEEAQSFSLVYLPAWELFGSLTDVQRKQFVTRKQIVVDPEEIEPHIRDGLVKALLRDQGGRRVNGRIVYYLHDIKLQVTSLTPAQRKALDRVFAASARVDGKRSDSDLLLQLYKDGAKKDLSNVDVEFRTMSKHAVHLMFGVQVGKDLFSGTSFWIAQI